MGVGGEGEEISAPITMPAYRKVAGEKPATPLRPVEVMGLPPIYDVINNTNQLMHSTCPDL